MRLRLAAVDFEVSVQLLSAALIPTIFRQRAGTASVQTVLAAASLSSGTRVRPLLSREYLSAASCFKLKLAPPRYPPAASTVCTVQ